jgi:hypothetical protein
VLRTLGALGDVTSTEAGRITLRVPKEETARAIGRLVATVPIADVTVADPPVEDVIEQVFAQGHSIGRTSDVNGAMAPAAAEVMASNRAREGSDGGVA